jgi:hypothetical protein
VALNFTEICWSDERLGSSTRVLGLMLWLAVVSVLSGIFDIKYYLHLQVRSTCSAHRLVGTFPFCTARATHLNPSSSVPIHQVERIEETLTTDSPTMFYDFTGEPDSTGGS